MAHPHIELGLSWPDRSGDRRALLPLVNELLQALGDSVYESETLNTAEFRATLGAFRQRLEEAADEPKALGRVAGECAEYCRAFVKRLQDHVHEREAEFLDLVGLIQQLVAAAEGEASQLDAKLVNSSERLTKIVELNDIRILKRRLSIELTTLRQVIDEQRARHEAQRDQLATEIQKLQRRLARSREDASLDPLTRVANRGRFDRTLHRWVAEHRQSGHAFVLGMLDLDGFKLVNDTYGHPAGDAMLVHVAQTLLRHVRATDLVARYGGDEFAVMLSGVTLAVAESRLKEALAELRLTPVAVAGVQGGLTVNLSGGLTEFTVHDTPADLVERADRALYQAKAAGRGRVQAAARPSASKLFHNGRPVARVS